MPFDRDDLKRVVKQFLDSSQRQSPFPDNIPGIDWLLSFEKRHPDLAKRKPQLLAQNRANNATPETINLFFDMFEKVVKENNLTADQIWNCDETGLNTDMTAKKVFIPKGKKDTFKKSNSRKNKLLSSGLWISLWTNIAAFHCLQREKPLCSMDQKWTTKCRLWLQ